MKVPELFKDPIVRRILAVFIGASLLITVYRMDPASAGNLVEKSLDVIECEEVIL